MRKGLVPVRPRKVTPERDAPTPRSAASADLGAAGSTYSNGNQRRPYKPDPPPHTLRASFARLNGNHGRRSNGPGGSST